MFAGEVAAETWGRGDESCISTSPGHSLVRPRSLRENHVMQPYRPGDNILDRYLKDAPPQQREEARENLRRLADLIMRVHERLERERTQATPREKADSAIDSESPLPRA